MCFHESASNSKIVILRRCNRFSSSFFAPLAERGRSSGVVWVGVCAGSRRVGRILPLTGEKAENEDGVEASVKSPAGDDAKDEGLTPHGFLSVGKASACVKTRMAMPLPLTKGRFGRNVHISMKRAATSSSSSFRVAARKRLR
jgi:hypothetical protein